MWGRYQTKCDQKPRDGYNAEDPVHGEIPVQCAMACGTGNLRGVFCAVAGVEEAGTAMVGMAFNEEWLCSSMREAKCMILF
jgi:hypothetical protein